MSGLKAIVTRTTSHVDVNMPILVGTAGAHELVFEFGEAVALQEMFAIDQSGARVPFAAASIRRIVVGPWVILEASEPLNANIVLASPIFRVPGTLVAPSLCVFVSLVFEVPTDKPFYMVARGARLP